MSDRYNRRPIRTRECLPNQAAQWPATPGTLCMRSIPAIFSSRAPRAVQPEIFTSASFDITSDTANVFCLELHVSGAEAARHIPQRVYGRKIFAVAVCVFREGASVYQANAGAARRLQFCSINSQKLDRRVGSLWASRRRIGIAPTIRPKSWNSSARAFSDKILVA